MIRKLLIFGFVFTGFVVSIAPTLRADEIADMTRTISSMGYDTPSITTLRNACDADALCVARFLRDRIGDGAELVPYDAPANKSRGWKKAGPAITSVTTNRGETLVLVLRRYDAVEALKAINKTAVGLNRVVLDIRNMDADTNMDAMRRMAAIFIGHRKRAFQVRYATGKNVDWRIPKPQTVAQFKALDVLVDRDTNGIGETFALLLEKHANATIKGVRTRGRGFILEQIPVTHGWALNVPRARLHIPGIDLQKGVLPAVALPN